MAGSTGSRQGPGVGLQMQSRRWVLDGLPDQWLWTSVLGMSVRGLLSETAKTLPYFSAVVS